MPNEHARGRVSAYADLPVSAWRQLIDEWIFSARDREILKRRLLDGIVFDALADEFDMSVRQVKNIVAKGMEVLIRHV